MRQTATMPEVLCLKCNPFEGDRDVVYRVLRDGFVWARAFDECMTCLGPIRPGDRVRARVEKFEGRVYTFRFCPDCCAAMAASWNDGGEAWTRRVELAYRKIDRQRRASPRGSER